RRGRNETESPELLHEQPRGLRFRFLFAAGGRFDFADIPDTDPNGEPGRVIRTRAFDHFVFRRTAAVAGGPFLKRALGMLRPAGAAFDCRLPELYHDIARGIESAFDKAGAEQRFHDVTEHVVAVRRAVVARLLAETDVIGGADLASK